MSAQPQVLPVRSTFNFGKGLTVAIACAVAALVVAAAVYFFATRTVESTDDAQIDGHIHPINARIAGTVVWVNPAVDDTHFVAAGTVLAKLDTKDYRPALDRLRGEVEAADAQLAAAQLNVPITTVSAQSRLASARNAVTESEAALSESRAGEKSAEALLTQAEENHRRAEADRKRYEELVNSHEISRSEYDQRMTDARTTAAQVEAAQAALLGSRQRIEAAVQQLQQRKNDLQSALTAPEMIASAHASVKRAEGNLRTGEAALLDAQQNLGYTDIVAPVSGIVGRKQIEVGQRVSVGSLLLNLVPTDDIWVIANFKETQLHSMRVGQRAKVHIDAYNLDREGFVESIGGATGSKYALIAPENATGNYVKVVQRIPVRIRFDGSNHSGKVLLPGMSVEAHVQVK